LIKNDPPIHLAKVDATKPENKPLSTYMDVKGFPTMIFFNKGRKIPF
jgi:thioredoxin-related protein